MGLEKFSLFPFFFFVFLRFSRSRFRVIVLLLFFDFLSFSYRTRANNCSLLSSIFCHSLRTRANNCNSHVPEGHHPRGSPTLTSVRANCSALKGRHRPCKDHISHPVSHSMNGLALCNPVRLCAWIAIKVA